MVLLSPVTALGVPLGVSDSFPLPPTGDLVDRVGSTLFITELDLLKRVLAGPLN